MTCRVDGCDRRHCIVDGRTHLDAHELQTCPRCIGQTRRDRQTILELVALGASMLDGWPARSPSAPSDGPTSSERALLVGELGVMLANGSQGLSQVRGIIADPEGAPHALDELPGDAQSVTWVFCSWEDDWRHTRNEPAAAGPASRALIDADRYLDIRTPWAAQHHPEFAAYAHDLTEARQRLEAALRAGPQRTPVPCITCGRRRLERPDEKYRGIEWRCTGCQRGYTESEYWQAVRAYGAPV